MQKLLIKLSSRKFWAAIITFVGALCVAFGASDMTAEKLTAVIASFSVLVAYIVGETINDAKSKSTSTAATVVKIDIKSKFTSRKFWAALVSFIVTLLFALGCDGITIEQVKAVVVAIGTVCVYILGESVIDATGSTSKDDSAFLLDALGQLAAAEASVGNTESLFGGTTETTEDVTTEETETPVITGGDGGSSDVSMNAMQ